MAQAGRASKWNGAAGGFVILRGCSRRGLMSSTALQAAVTVAVLAIHPAAAQLAPNTRPVGGSVVAGQASITQTPAKTTVNQSSQNAVVNWQGYNVGSAHTVQYVDPSSASITLNRVTGPNPSEIAGRIQSNGNVIIVNQAGVLFDKGAQINTAGLIVSSAGISNANLMAGKLIFDQPGKPDAKIQNNGTITIAREGLAALVAPQVANAGVIRANMGKVILAGAQADVLDLYGDGMVSINVTKQVQTAPSGNTALVTNTGVIEAKGGSIVLTAQAVDGVVQNLVDAGGRISASSAGGHTGKIVIAGRGGDLIVSGDVSANGYAPGTTGGAVVVNSTGAVKLTPTAKISASGPAGGGVIALGTTLKRATGGPSVTGQRTARTVVVPHGATIAANATASGNGGKVTLLAAQQTTMAGQITAKGGPKGGNGGFIEVSGSVVASTGKIDTSAPLGNVGTVSFDPTDLYISDLSPGQTILAGGTSWVSPAYLESLNSDILIHADQNMYFASSSQRYTEGGGTGNQLLLNTHSLNASAANSLTVDQGFSINAAGIALSAANITLGGSSGVAANIITLNELQSLTAASIQSTNGPVNFTGNVVQPIPSIVQSNQDITVSGTLIENGGNLIAVHDVSLGGLIETAGTIAAGHDLSVGNFYRAGVAGWAGSVAYSGTYNQTGGIAVANGSVNIFSSTGFAQGGGLLAAGGTLGVTTPANISIGGTVSAYGGPSGFMLLSTNGNATVLPGGLLAGSTAVAVNGDIISGNALQAPGGAVRIAAGTSPTFAQAQPVNATTTPATDAAPTLALPDPTPPIASTPSVPNAATGTLSAPGNLISAVLIGGTIDIEGAVLASTLGLYSRSLITEGPAASINAQILTGSAGVLRNNVLVPGLTALNWTDATTIGWTFNPVDTLGEVALNPAGGGNAIATLADFTATRDFALSDTPFGPSKVLTQTGTLQAGSALLDASYVGRPLPTWVTIAVAGSLAVGGVIANGIDDGQVRPGGNIQLSATNIASNGTVAAVVSAGNGGFLILNSADTFTQSGGVLNGGVVSVTAPGGANLTGGQIIATVSTIGIFAPVTNLDSNETVAAVNKGTDITFGGNVNQAANTYLGANRNLKIPGTLTEDGGTAIAGGNVTIGGLTLNSGEIAGGGALSIGAGTGVAGWAGSSPKSGSFVQNGGTIVSGGAANIFTTGTFTQANAVFATGGTLGVTAGNGIAMAGTVSAAGLPTGFMLLANQGDATLATSGLLAGAPVSVTGDIVNGNAVQAPQGTVLIAGSAGSQGFSAAPAIGGIAPATGYAMAPPANPPTVPLLTAPAFGTPGGTVPVVLIGSTVDIERFIEATTIGLYAKSQVIEGSNGAISATTLTGSAGVPRNGVLPLGLNALGWGNAATIGWTSGGADTLGNVSLTPTSISNSIGTLADFTATQSFALSDAAASLTQIGTLQGDTAQTAAYGGTPGAVSVSVTNAGSLAVTGLVAAGIDDGNARPGGNLTLTTTGPSGNAITLSGSITAVPAAANPAQGGIVTLASAGPITETGAITTRGTLTGSAGGDVNLNSNVNVATLGAFNASGNAFSLIDNSNLMLAGVINANSVVINDTASSLTLGPGNGFAGIGAGSQSPLNNEPFPVPGSPGVYLQANTFNVQANPAVSTSSVINWTFALNGKGTVALGNFQQPDAKLFLNLNSGIATGQINIAGLQVSYNPPPVSVTINLLGVVHGQTGNNAAASSQITPQQQANYQVNGCPIASFNCTKIVVNNITIPVINGLQDLDFGGMPFDFDDELLLPDVAEKDY